MLTVPDAIQQASWLAYKTRRPVVVAWDRVGKTVVVGRETPNKPVYRLPRYIVLDTIQHKVENHPR